MSRGRANNVRGPTSALTEYLKETGVTLARRVAVQQQQQAQAGPSNASNGQEGDEGPSSSPRPSRASTRTSARRRTSGYASDNLDEDEGDENEGERVNEDEDAEELEDSPPPPKKRKLTKAAEAKLKAQEKKKEKGKGKKKAKGSDDEDDDPYTSLSKSLWSNVGSKPPVGSFENCARCEKQFTVTKYTLAANPGPGWLCHLCAKSSGQDPFKKAAPKKRKAPGDKREVIHFVENRMPTLVSLCIKLVTQYIDDIESLGDVGALNVEAIAKAMAKNRSLTPENARLFYNTTNSDLIFYDATNLPSPAFETLVYMNPNLTSLRIDFCGQLDDNAFKVFISSLPALNRIELLGPFLVRAPSWQEFAKAHPNLEGFLINQSPRFDLDCMKALVEHCPGLKELRLREIGKMSDEFLQEVATLGSDALTYLDLSCPGASCNDSAMIELLGQVGGSLKHLDVSKHTLLTDEFLLQGLLQYTLNLTSLGMSHLSNITDKGLSSLLLEWENGPLLELDVSRNHELMGGSLEAIMKHSGGRLENLNINGWKDVEENALREIGRKGKEMKALDVGFCRNVDDFVVKDWLEGEEVHGVKRGGCPNLKELKIWGCNRVTDQCPRKPGFSLHGVESHIIRKR